MTYTLSAVTFFSDPEFRGEAMAAERLSMRKIKEFLRLQAAGH
jgi:hypothetical protein